MKTTHFALAAACVLSGFPVPALECLEPVRGCYFGFTLGSAKSIPDLSSKLGFTPAAYVEFFSFSDLSPDIDRIKTFLDDVTLIQGIAMLTLEPRDGLDQVTQTACDQVAGLCR